MVIEGGKFIVGGDIILSIQGKKVENESDIPDLKEIVKALKEKDIMKITVMRAGKIEELHYIIPK